MIYEIIDFNPINGVVTIAYEDGLTINVDLPIVKGEYPTGERLHNIILDMYPSHYAARLKEVKDATNTDTIKSLVVAKNPPEIITSEAPNITETINELDKEALFAEGVVDIVMDILKKNDLLKKV